MDLQQFQQLLLQKQKEIEQAMRRTLPVKVGRIAKEHFQEGFRQGGFQDNGTQAWQRKKRPDKYGPLMSSRQNLYGSIYYHPDDYSVTVGTSVPYAEIHNEGGEIVVTPRMKRFFRAKAYEAAGTFGRKKTNGMAPKKQKTISDRQFYAWMHTATLTPEAEFWCALSMKPVGATIKIPKRQFIGESLELTDKINNTIEKEINKILQQ